MKIKLSNRGWMCSACGALRDRDIQAVRTILKKGLATASA